MPAKKTKKGKEFTCNAFMIRQHCLFLKHPLSRTLVKFHSSKYYGGAVKEAQDLINHGTGNKERISQLFILNGKNREKVDTVFAGDIAVTIKLKDVRTSDSLMDPKN